MKYQKITTKSGYDIHVFDDLYEYSFMQSAFYYVEKSVYELGWSDKTCDDAGRFKYLHSVYAENHFNEINYIEQIKPPEARKIVGELLHDKVWGRTTVNLSHPFEPHFIHSHPNSKDGYIALYYANMEWQEPWAGETLFYSEDRKTVEFHSVYTPGRMILFDYRIPHTFRPPSILAPQYRFTVATFFVSGDKQ